MGFTKEELEILRFLLRQRLHAEHLGHDTEEKRIQMHMLLDRIEEMLSL